MININSLGRLCRVHCLALAACLVVTIFGLIFFQVSFGIFTMLAWFLPLSGLIIFFAIPNQGNYMLFLLGRSASCLSLLLVSQNLFRTAIFFRLRFELRFSWGIGISLWNGVYFLLTTTIIGVLIYFLLLNKTCWRFQCVGPRNYLLLWIVVMSGSGIFYRLILLRFLFACELITLSYIFWLMSATLTILSCYELKMLFRRRRI